MHPHSYTVDTLSKSQDLASSILSSSTPPQISSVCASIDSFLHSYTPDQSRYFFSIAFPTLICKLYGFDDSTSPPNQQSSAGGWLDIIHQANDPILTSRVFNVLAPNSQLFRSIFAVDRQSPVKYVFPLERLPEWARFVLSGEKDCQVLNALCPLFKDKIKEDSIKGGGSLYYQVQLNVFEYFMFWFAYYPVCKGNSENLKSLATERPKKFKLENWTSSIPCFSHPKHGNERNVEGNDDLYMRLLYAYLCAFVPICDLNSHQPYRGSLLHYGYGNDGSVLYRAEFFVDMLMNYWLVDNDFSPLNVNVCKSWGLSFKLRLVSGETPPTPNLGEVVKLLVKYLNLSASAVKEGIEHFENPSWSRGSSEKSKELVASINSPMRVVGSWNAWIQRPAYRFILRSFIFCPVGTSIKNASQVFSVWATYLEPWKISLGDFAELDAIIDGSGNDVKKEGKKNTECGYSSSWQGYVLSNYLYYSSLVMHFFGFAHKFLHTDPEMIVQMVLKVIKILTSSKELTGLIKNVDTAFHLQQAGSGKSIPSSLYGYIPLIREQLQDWEYGLCESDADGSFLHENWNKDLRLFGDGEDGGQQLLQLFILRAEAELQANSGDNLARNLQCIDSLKLQISCFFGGHTVKQISFMPEVKHEQSRDEIFKPRRVFNHASYDVKYKGDWMKRPISDNEVAWLAKFLVWLSIWLNENLGLHQAERSNVDPKMSYVEPPTDAGNVCGPTEIMKITFCALCSWFLMSGAMVVRVMRKHGVRVNLRMLASKKIVMVLLACSVFSVLRRVLGV
ncbi:ALTERED INHERITANCE OF MITOCHONDRIA PROTEIN 24 MITOCHONDRIAL [Salix viminalis]|uniref:ALTERED INHERITANCE OF MITOCHONDRIA PROTEIN 24 MITOCHONDRIAL n=1 Tax=Salix viminalis TaxID=40686 RepID=A0A9Q0TNT3_SALVM|nr:ALTERED INHERITANCE OF MITOCHONDRIA PROTEIN 24 MITOCHONDRIAL [Salix viminalis]